MIVNYDRFPLIYHMKEAITCIPGKPSPSSLWLSPGAILNLSYSQWCYVFVNECVVHYVKSIFLKERSFQYNSGHLLFCLQEEFLLNEQSTFEEFEKKIDYRTVLGAGAYGKCYLAAFKRVDTKEERVFCVKKVRPKSMETSAQ